MLTFKCTGSPLKTEFHLDLPAPQPGPRAGSSVWGEQAAGGRRGDGPEHRTTSAGRLVNSGCQENISLAYKHKDDTRGTL